MASLTRNDTKHQVTTRVDDRTHCNFLKVTTYKLLPGIGHQGTSSRNNHRIYKNNHTILIL
uniref:Uncharacterized protein n=1 Tax=Arundo donax TaxID=35708 RepID=A0A0A8XWM0_ARUDO